MQIDAFTAARQLSISKQINFLKNHAKQEGRLQIYWYIQDLC